MKQLEDILSAIKVPTSQLSSQQIQAVLLETKRHQNSESNQTYWNEVLEILWHHIQSCVNKFDDQLLCATCLYSVLSLTDKQQSYVEKIFQVISDELNIKDNDKESSNSVLAISLMYGIFQSSYLTQKEDFLDIETTLQAIFKLLTLMAYEYSKFTFLAFKIINSFSRICGIAKLRDIIFCKENHIILLNLTNHNWENPITGVRDLNKDIFHTLIFMLDKNMYDVISEEINTIYWNKAKYLMLAEIIEHSQCQDYNSRYTEHWVDGLINSLHKPGLVSAGTDMYHSVLNKIKSETEWCDIFLKNIMKIFNGLSAKAIDNFSNYWCLTTLKRFPYLLRVFLDELGKCGHSEHTVFSTLHIIKQANKLGLVIKNWEDNTCVEKSVLTGLEHCKSQIRVLAFEVLCISHTKSLPIKIEYELIMKFLQNNMNSDCTVLRISMLNNFGAFLTQAHINFINNVKKSDECVEDLYDFCTKLQDLITSCLNVNGNYQRKITVIKLAKLFLGNLSQVPNKKKKQTRKANTGITEILKGKDLLIIMKDTFISKLVCLLNDHSEDIRENVIELLLDYYSEHIEKETYINALIKSALENVESKFFYDISCGHSMFKLISRTLVKNQSQAIFNGVQDLLEFVWKEFVFEYKLRRGIVESIEKGKQLHSLVNILRIVLEVYYKNYVQFKIPENCSMIECLEALDDISHQFAWEEDNSTSSDFSKMSDMVENLINDSGFICQPENDQTKISGLHQIVLNCLWLNIRASCELASLIIQYQTEESYTTTVQKCLSIITRVLETCRHKGAIEAAGVSLGQAIRHLTSISNYSSLSQLPMDLLKCKLNDLISEASKMASVTRRGAGLSIMVHKIVSNDMKKGKPLFHYFMKTLLKTCKKAVDSPDGLGENTENERDLRKAINIHFLTKIVHDSSLASDIMYYSAELAELAFGNLTSRHWQIRNAALQLYGALVPKLIGQRKLSGTDDETIATVACDEFRTHSPKLWKYILQELNHEGHKVKIQNHSNLIPILNMLANMARRYTFSYDTSEQDDLELLASLILLLDSPIYTTRRLTAKCIFNMYSLQIISSKIMKQDKFTENFLHGCLMLTSYYKRLFQVNSLQEDDFKILELKFRDILNSSKHSYLSKAVFEELCYHTQLGIDLRRTFIEVDDSVHAPGIFLWANGQVEKSIKRMSEEELPHTLELILDRNDFEVYGELFFSRIESDGSLTKEALLKVSNILMNCKSKWNSCMTWKILYHVSKQVNLSKYIDVSTILNYLKEQKYPYKLRYLIPFIAKICTSHDDCSTICTVTNSLANSNTNDVDIRYIAAVALNELSERFSDLPDQGKCDVLISAIKLLQDEDEDIRNVVVEVYKNISNSLVAPHPYICLTKILDLTFLNNHLSKTKIAEFCIQLTKYCDENSNCSTNDEYNPFANESKNIYLEVDILKQLVDNVKGLLYSL